MRSKVATAALLAALVPGAMPACGAAEQRPGVRPGFAHDPRFADGRAEVHTYDAVVHREGAPRSSRAYTVFVAEDLDPHTLVKADDWRRPGLLRAFKYGQYFTAQTGMAEFREAINGFVAADGWRPVKLLYSAQDWCGLTFKSVLPGERDAELAWTGYWEADGGSGRRVLAGAAGAIPTDLLPAWIRGLALAPGAEFRVAVIPTLQGSRVGRPAVVAATVTVGAAEDAELPAGRFRALPVRVAAEGIEMLLHVEEGFPHRIVRWRDTLGQEFLLAKSQRIAYWQHVADGEERLLEP